MEEEYKCSNCNYESRDSELEYDEIETCFGTDHIEMCPHCGSYEVRRILKS